jgi:hypothetical protein
MNADVLANIASFCNDISSRLAFKVPPRKLQRNVDLDGLLTNMCYSVYTTKRSVSRTCLRNHWRIRLNHYMVVEFGCHRTHSCSFMLWKFLSSDYDYKGRQNTVLAAYSCHWGESVEGENTETVTVYNLLDIMLPVSYGNIIIATLDNGQWLVRMEDNCLVPSDHLKFRKYDKVLYKLGYVLADTHG